MAEGFASEALYGLTCAMASLGPYALWPFQLPKLWPNPKPKPSRLVGRFSIMLNGRPEGMVVAGKDCVPGVVVLDWGQSEVIQQWQRDHRRRLEEGSVLLEVNGIFHLQGILDELQRQSDLRLVVSRPSPRHLSTFKLALFKGQWDLGEVVLEDVLLEPEETCAICHDDLSAGVRLACGHRFHAECAKEWLKRK